jgi:hypothetical protein
MTKDPILDFMATASKVPYPAFTQVVASTIDVIVDSTPPLKRLSGINYRIPASYISWPALRDLFTIGYASVEAMVQIADLAMTDEDRVRLADALTAHTASTCVSRYAAPCEFPFWVVSRGLCEMLGRTDSLADPNIKNEACLPFKSCYFVIPNDTIQVGEDEYITVIGCAHLSLKDIEACGFTVPKDQSDDKTRFYVTAYTNKGACLYSKLLVTPEGVVSDPSTHTFTLYSADGLTIDEDKARREESINAATLAVGWALKLLTAMNAEIELVDGLEKLKHRKAKNGKRELLFLQPRWLGVRIRSISSDRKSGESGSGSVQMHWRRGHMARRRCGKGRIETRLVFIKPTLVNAPEAADKI